MHYYNNFKWLDNTDNIIPIRMIIIVVQTVAKQLLFPISKTSYICGAIGYHMAYKTR